MNYHKIKKDDMLNGEGLRVTLFVSGCENNCKRHHNPETHDPYSGFPFTETSLERIFNQLEKPHISGLTITGGDPLHPSNRCEVFKICELVKEQFPNKNIWIYTGYDLEELDGEMISDFNQNVDVWVTGRYVEELKSPDLHWVGSSNQKVIKKQVFRKNNKHCNY